MAKSIVLIKKEMIFVTFPHYINI